MVTQMDISDLLAEDKDRLGYGWREAKIVNREGLYLEFKVPAIGWKIDPLRTSLQDDGKTLAIYLDGSRGAQEARDTLFYSIPQGVERIILANQPGSRGR